MKHYLNSYELSLLKAFDSGQLKSIASKSEITTFNAAAKQRAIDLKNEIPIELSPESTFTVNSKT